MCRGDEPNIALIAFGPIDVATITARGRSPWSKRGTPGPRDPAPSSQNVVAMENHRHDTSLFPTLVLGCIKADFGHQIVILQHFSRSTRFSHFCTARNAIFWRNLSKFSRKLSKFSRFLKFRKNVVTFFEFFPKR